MGEGEPRVDEGQRILDSGYYQKKRANIAVETRPDGVILVKVVLGEKDKHFPNIPVEVYSCINEQQVAEAVGKIRSGKDWEEMN